jgi:hypothetical protein
MIRIPSSVEFLGKECFYGCESLCEVTFESGSKLKRIEEHGFEGNCVSMIQIPSSVEFLGTGCFWGCNWLREVTFEGNIREIGCRAFDTCLLKCVKVPRGVKLNYEFPEKCRIECIDIAKIVGKRKVFMPKSRPVKASKTTRVKRI